MSFSDTLAASTAANRSDAEESMSCKMILMNPAVPGLAKLLGWDCVVVDTLVGCVILRFRRKGQNISHAKHIVSPPGWASPACIGIVSSGKHGRFCQVQLYLIDEVLIYPAEDAAAMDTKSEL